MGMRSRNWLGQRFSVQLARGRVNMLRQRTFVSTARGRFDQRGGKWLVPLVEAAHRTLDRYLTPRGWVVYTADAVQTKGERMIDFSFDEEPIATRTSHVFGEINLYAPDADPAEWTRLPFMITTEHGEWKVRRRKVERINPDTMVMEEVEVSEGSAVENKNASGVKLLVKSARAHDAFNRLSLLRMDDLWEDETAEVMSL